MNKVVAFLGCAVIAGSAAAQSSVSLYGIADASMNYTDYKRAAAGHLLAVDSGGGQSARIGFRGSENIGDGLSAFYQLEVGFGMDTGALLYNGRLFGRQAMVGLDSKTLGAIALGRISPFSAGAGVYDMWRTIDPFKTAFGIAGSNNTFSAGAIRLDNAVAYKTPVLGGIQAGVMYSFQSALAPTAEIPGSRNNTRTVSTGLSYTAGPVYAVITVDMIKPAVLSTGPLAGRAYPTQKTLQVGATYDAGVVKLHAAYAKQKDHSVYSPIAEELGVVSTVDPAARPDADTYLLGVTIPIRQHSFLASYRLRDGKPFRTTATSTFEADRRVLGFAYLYSLSKRTRLYTELAESSGRKSIAEGIAATDTYNRREFRLGINHTF
ncbi:porin [Massilia niastensis]|uniref:porin n=1 Tax=Massilia niastensis TaxID=544911 RepID=UPI000381F597|nr:porin [Massilia niastensis]